MVEQKQDFSAVSLQHSNLQSFPKIPRSSDKKGIDQWLRSVDKWRAIMSLWKKESALLQKLVTLSLTGRQADPMEKMRGLSNDMRELISEVQLFEKDLLQFREQVPLMHRNILFYHNRYLEAKQTIKAVASRYDRMKTALLEELASSFPISIF